MWHKSLICASMYTYTCRYVHLFMHYHKLTCIKRLSNQVISMCCIPGVKKTCSPVSSN